eukprot:g3679.t1
MKVPLIEITESLELQARSKISVHTTNDINSNFQNTSKTFSEIANILWAIHPKNYLLAASAACTVSIFHSNSRTASNDKKGGGGPLLSRLSAISFKTGVHKITAISWLVNLVPQSQKQNGHELDTFASHLMLGTEKGEFLIYDLTGEVILHQKLHNASVLQIRCRPNCISFEESSIEDISVIFNDVLCCIPLPEVLAFIRLHEAGSGQTHDPSLKLAHGKFGIGKNLTGRTDGFHLGIQPPLLKDELKIHERSQETTKIGILSIGKSPAMGVFEAAVDGSRGGAFAFIGKMATAVTLGIPSLAWKSGKRAWRRGVTSWWTNNKEDELIPTEQSYLQYSLRDTKRSLLTLVPAPQDSLAVSTDNLGRVLLLDTHKGVVLRIWKGYRETQCAWLTKSDGHLVDSRLYLVIFGKRRETIELWPMRYGPRIWSMFIGSNNRLLSTTPPMGLGNAPWSVKCSVLDYENEEIWDVEQRAFVVQDTSKMDSVWDRMLPKEST